MSDENHVHESPIKTPGQLITVIVLAFVIPIVLIVLLTQLVTSGKQADPAALAPEAVAQRIKPVADVALAEGGGGAAKTDRSGEEIYKTTCSACHATGVANAPKFGDKAAWASHLKEGQKHLAMNAISGVRAMPPRGGNADLSDLEVERAMVYMVNAAGATFKEPAMPVVKAAGKPDGKKIYDSTCTACHAAGVAGAPKFGDKAAWAPRLKAGIASLYNSALKGKNAMPPKGGNLTLGDADVKAGVDYMTAAVK